MEAQLWALQKIGVIIGSFLMGFVFFYMTNPFHKKMKKSILEQLSSLLINFVIYIWVGKIILNIHVFVQDPLAILAYPSDSAAFYVASLLISLHIGWNVWRRKMDLHILEAFVPVFLGASFIYEFVQIFWYEDRYTWLYIGLINALILFFLLVEGHFARWKLSLYIMILWCLGQMILSFVMPFATVFSYIISPWYVGALLLLIGSLFVYLNRKLVSE